MKLGGKSRSAAGRGPDVAVIGTGIVGACCAAQLALEGCSVTFVEANEPGVGASFGNAGALSPSSCIPLSLPGVLRKVPSWLLSAHGPLVVRPSYALRALPWLAKFVAAGGLAKVEAIADALRALHGPTHECYRPLLQAAGATALVRQSGALVVYGSVKSFRATLVHWEMRRERGAKFEILDGPAIRELVPALATTFERAVLQPDHGYVANPKALVIKLVELALSRGGRLVHGRAAGIVEAGDKLAVKLESGQSVSADHVVIAAGAWSGELMRRLRLSIPLETQRGYHLHLVRPSVVLNLPISFADDKFYVTPMDGGLRLAGTVEFAGLTAPPDYRRAHQVGKIAQRWLPDLTTENASEWMGHRPCLPDSLPVIGPVPGRRRIWAAFGHGHNGMTGASTTGRVIADMIQGRAPFIDPTPYRVERFL